MLFGAIAVVLVLSSMATRTETAPTGYAIFEYVLLAFGAVAFVGSLVKYLKQKNAP